MQIGGEKVDLNKVYGWLTAKDFAATNPLNFSISEVRISENNKPEICGIVNGQLKRTEIFGDMQNMLIAAFGSNTDKWIGKNVKITREEKIGEKARRIFST